MNNPFRSGALWFALLTLNLLAIPVSAQVPQDMTYTGRLVDNLGFPLASPVTLELRVFDAATVGTQLYSEQHLGVVLDATGGFSVQLGLGTSAVGPLRGRVYDEKAEGEEGEDGKEKEGSRAANTSMMRNRTASPGGESAGTSGSSP